MSCSTMPRARETFWETDLSPAAWLRDAVGPWAYDVASLVPRGFAAYARVLHPVGVDDLPNGERQRWADIARANGRVAHATLHINNIVNPRGTPSATDDIMPGLGALPLRERGLLVELLASATTTPDRCWFCVWEGWGSIDDQGVAARVELPNRAYLLHAGPIAAALAVPPQSAEGATFSTVSASTVNAPGQAPRQLTREEKVRWLEQSWHFGPALWWPDDRAWMVVTEIDFGWTYVGGTEQTIQRVLTHPEFEAWPAQLTDRFTDPVNAALDAPGE
jgi:hypothetical protein